MSLKGLLFGRGRQEQAFDPNPGTAATMPARPYRVLHADVPFYSDPEGRESVKDARLLVLRCEDPNQKHTVIECMPTMKRYSQGQTVTWELNNKKIWESAWYVNPDTGKTEKAWTHAVEFAGRIVTG